MEKEISSDKCYYNKYSNKYSVGGAFYAGCVINKLEHNRKFSILVHLIGFKYSQS